MIVKLQSEYIVSAKERRALCGALYNYTIVETCRDSKEPSIHGTHRKKDGTVTSSDAPLFFRQCPCDPKSDLGQLFQPKPGFTLVFLSQSMIPVWHREFAKFYDPNETRIKLEVRVTHGKHKKEGAVLRTL